MSQSLESVVGCLVGRIEGVTVLVLSVGITGGGAGINGVGLDEEAGVDVAIMLSAIIRRRVPARILGL